MLLTNTLLPTGRCYGESRTNGRPTQTTVVINDQQNEQQASVGNKAIYFYYPATAEWGTTPFYTNSADEIKAKVQSAAEAFAIYRQKRGGEKAIFLETIAAEIEAIGEALIQICSAETALPAARLQGERARTTGQLRLFAGLLREGSWVKARIDTAMPDRTPLPRPDLRQMQIGLGPVAVFDASNFPLAFSVAGGDTASALAAGCPVVFKAHPAHPATSHLIAAPSKKPSPKQRCHPVCFCSFSPMGRAAAGPNGATPVLFTTNTETFLAHESLREEVFGPASMLVEGN